MSENRNPVGWFEIYVQDMARAKTFYEKTFDVSLQHLTSDGLEMWAWPMFQDASGCPGALVKMEGKDSGVGGVIIYFPCDDCAALAERAAKNGARIQKPKTAIGQYGFISLVVDTEGNMIGLHSMK
jgi:predicted enzyme related to lactoylglutathione lyase